MAIFKYKHMSCSELDTHWKGKKKKEKKTKGKLALYNKMSQSSLSMTHHCHSEILHGVCKADVELLLCH